MACYCGHPRCPECSGTDDPPSWRYNGPYKKNLDELVDDAIETFKTVLDQTPKSKLQRLPKVGDLVKLNTGGWGILMFIKADEARRIGTRTTRPGKYIIYMPTHPEADGRGVVTRRSTDMLADLEMVSRFEECKG